MDMLHSEKERQESLPWTRSTYHSEYNHYLAHYKVKSCLEHARGNSLLDIACGDGLMTEAFAKYFQRVVGVDASGKHLAAARERVSQGEFHECLIEQFDIKERFDSVFMLD
ncbi:MAG: class I SAM-dependent methyltransferase, partial [Methanosarcinales archaeon]